MPAALNLVTPPPANPADTPSLPQHNTVDEQAQRAFQLALARTDYNYMRSYLESVPMSADLPPTEKFSIDYEAQVLAVFLPLAANFKRAVMQLLERELRSDLPTDALQAVEAAYAKLRDDFSLLHPMRDAEEIKALVQALVAIPRALEATLRLPQDLLKMATGLEQAFGDFIQNGPTGFLKSTLFDMLAQRHGRDYLAPQSVADYADLMADLPTPLMMAVEPQAWMPTDQGLPCEQDWFFGWLQTAGFNTTQLRGVVPTPGSDDAETIALADLLRKMPLSDAQFAETMGEPGLTLAEAARSHRLYACDYAALDGLHADPLHGVPRYLAAPVALFCWSRQPSPGYPALADGVLRPVAIQLAQQHDPEAAPIFTPGDVAGAGDANGLKWRLAKYIVNVCSAIQHESVAHLGDCHLIIEPMVVAAHRQLAAQHPLLQLLKPHFRFTITNNDSAIHSLIVPGGVVATNVGPAIEDTLKLVADAHRAWRWDDRQPETHFRRRGVDRLPQFPFRDDTRLLWAAVKRFVDGYLRVYYRSDADVRNDTELQGWVHELTAPAFCGFKGLGGLTATGNPDRPWALESLDYLIEMVAQIIYTAGPQHAAVNYAQYPLMSYMPAVAGTLYRPAPNRSTVLATEQDCLPWYPPLDVGLYTLSFEFLLSGVQFDRFGHYETNPRAPYFTDKRVQPLVADLQDALARAELEIRQRNQSRPVAYPFQLPSQVPNSISI